jgi:hypothetical protein
LPTIPDALALLDPKDALREVVAFTKRMNEWVQQMNAVQRRDQMITYYPPNYALLGITPDPRRIQPPPPTPDSDYSKVKCFRKPDLEDDVREAEQALLWFLSLQRALFDPSSQARDEARQEISAVPQIAQASE